MGAKEKYTSTVCSKGRSKKEMVFNSLVTAFIGFFFTEAYLPCALKQMNMPTFLKLSWRAQASVVLTRGVG